MWYVVINDRLVPIPYQRYQEAWEAAAHYKETMCAVCVSIVNEDSIDNYR